jgi:hypothetical protein
MPATLQNLPATLIRNRLPANVNVICRRKVSDTASEYVRNLALFSLRILMIRKKNLSSSGLSKSLGTIFEHQVYFDTPPMITFAVQTATRRACTQDRARTDPALQVSLSYPIDS